ncbi:hypothetical protein HWV62_12330 [Athelia sp. TMB]|nr:hypothetical protein HWV62_12330 [Athelia sp. TMB]
MAGSARKSLQTFNNMCGKEAMPRVVVGTTMWGDVPQQTGEQREEELKGKWWKDMIAQGCHVQRFTDSYDSAWEVIGKLGFTDKNVLVSREIVHDKMPFTKTTVGQTFGAQIEAITKGQKEADYNTGQQAAQMDGGVIVAKL